MRGGENRINPSFLAEFNRALDEVEQSQGNAALVSTGEGKFYSNGLDLDALSGIAREQTQSFLIELDRLFARLLAFPTATVAAINGHAFAAGAMLALAHDFRVMRSDRGFVCFPEIHMGTGQPLTQGMYALIGARIPQSAFHETLITGRRYGAPEAVRLQMVHEAKDEADVLPRAVEIARELAGKDRATMSALKRGLLQPALDILEHVDADS